MLVLPLFVGIMSVLPAVYSLELINITAEAGQNIILPCQAPNNTKILGVKWINTDLGPKYVLFHRDGQSDPDNQLPAFTNRSKLMNGGTKDGDLSLMLGNVKTDDTGRYMCQIKKAKKGHIKTEAIAIINLDVSANSTGGTAGDTLDGHRHIGMVAGLIIVGTTCLCVGIFLKLKKPMINIPPLCSLDEANI